jgi:ABC-type multidrug transport system ATPase subunit
MNNPKDSISSISLTGIGKKFSSRWVFRNVGLELQPGDRIAINGSNGSGKSTLLKIISGYMTPSEGSVIWSTGNSAIPTDKIAKHISYAAPYLDLIEPFTLEENVRFFCRMKQLLNNAGSDEVISISGLEHAAATPVRNLSSGMKQRLKLTLAFMADSGLLLLDEPLSNLDERGYTWYSEISDRFLGNRIAVVCSNHVSQETTFCNRKFDLESFR